MTTIDRDLQQYAADTIASQAQLLAQEISIAYTDPSVLYRPKVAIDGDQWCALYGESLQDGVAGFGDSPAEAMKNFNVNWYKKLGQS